MVTRWFSCRIYLGTTTIYIISASGCCRAVFPFREAILGPNILWSELISLIVRVQLTIRLSHTMRFISLSDDIRLALLSGERELQCCIAAGCTHLYFLKRYSPWPRRGYIFHGITALVQLSGRRGTSRDCVLRRNSHYRNNGLETSILPCRKRQCWI